MRNKILDFLLTTEMGCNNIKQHCGKDVQLMDVLFLFWPQFLSLTVSAQKLGKK